MFFAEVKLERVCISLSIRVGFLELRPQSLQGSKHIYYIL